MVQPQYEPGIDSELRAGEALPSRGLALVFGLIASGLGHVYLGQLRRGVLWACVPIALALSFAAAVVVLPLRWAFGVFLPVLLLIVGIGWGAALGDVLLVPRQRFRSVRWWYLPLFWLGSVAFSVLAALGSRTFLVQAFKIPSGSMQPSLMLQDHVFVNMRTFREPPWRGQLAVFTSPEQAGVDFLKRVIALPGDELSVEGGLPSINGWRVPHCAVGKARLPGADPAEGPGDVELEFLGDQAYLIFLADRGAEAGVQGPWVVPPGEVFVLGDSRNNSADSRSYNQGRGGGVPLPSLRGQPVFVWLSFNFDGSVNGARYGRALDQPSVSDWPPDMQAALRECLAKRPPRARTEPPRASSGG